MTKMAEIIASIALFPAVPIILVGLLLSNLVPESRRWWIPWAVSLVLFFLALYLQKFHRQLEQRSRAGAGMHLLVFRAITILVAGALAAWLLLISPGGAVPGYIVAAATLSFVGVLVLRSSS